MKDDIKRSLKGILKKLHAGLDMQSSDDDGEDELAVRASHATSKSAPATLYLTLNDLRQVACVSRPHPQLAGGFADGAKEGASADSLSRYSCASWRAEEEYLREVLHAGGDPQMT